MDSFSLQKEVDEGGSSACTPGMVVKYYVIHTRLTAFVLVCTCKSLSTMTRCEPIRLLSRTCI